MFSHLSAYTLASAECVCRQWKQLTNFDALWYSACHEAFALSSGHWQQHATHLPHRWLWK